MRRTKRAFKRVQPPPKRQKPEKQEGTLPERGLLNALPDLVAAINHGAAGDPPGEQPDAYHGGRDEHGCFLNGGGFADEGRVFDDGGERHEGDPTREGELIVAPPIFRFQPSALTSAIEALSVATRSVIPPLVVAVLIETLGIQPLGIESPSVEPLPIESLAIEAFPVVTLRIEPKLVVAIGISHDTPS
jgi:hypothetical protein